MLCFANYVFSPPAEVKVKPEDTRIIKYILSIGKTFTRSSMSIPSKPHVRTIFSWRNTVTQSPTSSFDNSVVRTIETILSREDTLVDSFTGISTESSLALESLLPPHDRLFKINKNKKLTNLLYVPGEKYICKIDGVYFLIRCYDKGIKGGTMLIFGFYDENGHIVYFDKFFGLLYLHAEKFDSVEFYSFGKFEHIDIYFLQTN